MTSILHRQIHKSYPTAVGGDGVMLVDQEGREFIDASCGAAVSCLGHQHPDVLAAMHAQVDQLVYAHTSFFTTDAAEALAEDLATHAPAGLNHVYFVSGGSEGIESALKLSRQYFHERGEAGRRRFIAREQSYHGNTIGALSVGGNRWRKTPFEPILLESHHIAPCYDYRHRRREEAPEEFGARMADLLEEKLLELGPETVIGFLAETVVGATLGAVPPAPGYFKRIREICDRYGILMILDEVMCGMGRTGTLHACTQEGVVPDLMIVAKGLAGGYAPLGAVLVSDHVFDTLAQGSGAFQHGHTYVGHPLSCAAGLAVQRVIRRDNLLENVRLRGADMEQRLTERFANHRHVGDIRGRGLFWGLELVADRATKAPFDPALKLHARVKAEAMERGLMVYPMGGTVDGRSGDHVLLAPPFIVDPETIDAIVERLADAMGAAIKSLE